MAASKISGFAVAEATLGGILLWSGIKGSTLSGTFQSLLKGQVPQADASEAITAGSTSSPVSSAKPGNTGAATATAAQNQALGKLLAAPYGWATGQQWADLVSLWNQESGWNNTAQNPSSTAYGIAQFLDTTWAPYGPKTSSAALQIKYGLEYIKDRYGSPEAAWAHETEYNWY